MSWYVTDPDTMPQRQNHLSKSYLYASAHHLELLLTCKFSLWQSSTGHQCWLIPATNADAIVATNTGETINIGATVKTDMATKTRLAINTVQLASSVCFLYLEAEVLT